MKHVKDCGQCNQRMPAGREDRKYCSPSCRVKAWRKAHGVDAKACTYCGALSDTIDHVPARSVRAFLREHAHGVYPEIEVPCCRECNSALGARGFSLVDRRDLARRHIEKKYAGVLRSPHWTPEELAEMGPNLRTDIEQHRLLKEWVLERLHWSR